MSPEKLKPCPFCGNDDGLTIFGIMTKYVCCGYCGSEGPSTDRNQDSLTIKEAISAWNRRVRPAGRGKK